MANGVITIAFGTEGADLLYGTTAFDPTLLYGEILYGLGGADSIYAQGGADFVWAGAGDDVVFGGADNDALVGQEGNDWLDGESGDDVVIGDAGADTLRGHVGDDWLWGGSGDDRLDGGAGADVLVGDLDGQAGADLLSGGPGHDVLIGGGGADVYVSDGTSQAARFGFGQGADVVWGFSLAGGDRLLLARDDYSIGLQAFAFTNEDGLSGTLISNSVLQFDGQGFPLPLVARPVFFLAGVSLTMAELTAGQAFLFG